MADEIDLAEAADDFIVEKKDVNLRYTLHQLESAPAMEEQPADDPFAKEMAK